MRKIITAFLMTGVMFLAITAAARADENADRIAAAKEMLTATHADDAMKQIAPAVAKQIKTLLIAQNSKIATDLDAIMPIFETELTNRSGEMLNEVAKIYAARFTASEIHDITAFFKTPTGVKLASQQGALAMDGMKAGQDWARKVAPEVLEKIKAELRKKGHEI